MFMPRSELNTESYYKDVEMLDLNYIQRLNMVRKYFRNKRMPGNFFKEGFFPFKILICQASTLLKLTQNYTNNYKVP